MEEDKYDLQNFSMQSETAKANPNMWVCDGIKAHDVIRTLEKRICDLENELQGKRVLWKSTETDPPGPVKNDGLGTGYVWVLCRKDNARKLVARNFALDTKQYSHWAEVVIPEAR